MARLGGCNQFDTSDVEDDIDSLDGVLDVAVEILAENAEDPGWTRIERMARYLATNLGGEPYHGVHAGAIGKLDCDGATVWRVGDQIALADSNPVASWADVSGLQIDVRTARKLAVALLRVAELVEES